ncbi:MAG: putative metal-binding motif-containing protein [Bacteroidetes bacterium]|nr:putative metal-binding motif-containing protein [Bacteroidota bacterium]
MSREYIQVLYNDPAPVNFIDIYETYNPGAVDTVYIKNPVTGLFEVVYTGNASPQLPQSGKLHISFPVTTFNVAEIRIAINSPAVPGWNEIDAVGIGIEQTYLWSTGATTASITAVTGGIYSVSVSNGFCESVSVPVEVTELPAPLLWHVDADGDAYGSTAMDSLSCSQPLGYVLNTTDCNDAASSIYPGANEICYNGVDENCNGLTDENCNGTLNLTLLLEGYYNGTGGMVPTLLHAGVGFNSNECDTVHVELRDGIFATTKLAEEKWY